MDTILHYVLEYANRTPDRLFAADPKGCTDYRKAWELIQRGAFCLLEKGIRKGDRVAVECTQDRSFLLAGLAAEAAGAVLVPLESGIKEDNLSTILALTEAALVITDGSLPLGSYKDSGKLLSFDDLLSSPARQELSLPKAEDTAEILFTTGTTGTSKGVVLTHANNVAIAENISSGCRMRDRNIEFVPLPLSHSHGLRTCYGNILKGGGVIITDGVSKVSEIYDLLTKYQATAMDLSPTAASVLLRLSRGRFSVFNSTMDYIELGTAPLTQEIKSEIKKAFPDLNLYNFYGSTESGRSCILNFKGENDLPYCIGSPAKHAEFYVADDEGRPIRSGRENTGRLICRGSMNMKGYWKQERLTETVLIDGAVLTADEGYIDEEGRVFCLGRMDDVINYRGIKISPQEIEEIAASFPGIREAVLVGAEDRKAGQVPVLCYVTAGSEIDEDAYYSYLTEHIEKDRWPRRLVACDAVPHTANGKIRRKELRERINGTTNADKA